MVSWSGSVLYIPKMGEKTISVGSIFLDFDFDFKN